MYCWSSTTVQSQHVRKGPLSSYTSPYVGQNFSEVKSSLESNVDNVFKWFHENDLMVNSSKSHFLISPYETKSIQIQNSCIRGSSSEELLRIKSDSNLTFHDHIISLCSIANKKLSALSRVSKYMGINTKRILMKSYFLTIFLLSLSLQYLT